MLPDVDVEVEPLPRPRPLDVLLKAARLLPLVEGVIAELRDAPPPRPRDGADIAALVTHSCRLW